jgi:hypothetical protein
MIAVNRAGDLFATGEGHRIHDYRDGTPKDIGTAQIRAWNATTGAKVASIAVEDAMDAVVFNPN